jgi:hypothetical protein
MLHSLQEWIKPSHVLLHTASAKLPLDPYRLISDIFELGVVKQSPVVWCDGGSKSLKGVLERVAGLGGGGHQAVRRRRRCARKSGAGTEASNTAHSSPFQHK